MGPRSSALVGGYTHAHRELEGALAELKGAEEALLFPTGYAANLAALSALGGDPDVTIFSDELNHASIIDGARCAARAAQQKTSLLPLPTTTRRPPARSPTPCRRPPTLRRPSLFLCLFSQAGDARRRRGAAGVPPQRFGAPR